MSNKLDLQDAQRLQLVKQHYRELIEAENRKFIENEGKLERLQKDMRMVLK